MTAHKLHGSLSILVSLLCLQLQTLLLGTVSAGVTYYDFDMETSGHYTCGARRSLVDVAIDGSDLVKLIKESQVDFTLLAEKAILDASRAIAKTGSSCTPFSEQEKLVVGKVARIQMVHSTKVTTDMTVFAYQQTNDDFEEAVVLRRICAVQLQLTYASPTGSSKPCTATDDATVKIQLQAKHASGGGAFSQLGSGIPVSNT